MKQIYLDYQERCNYKDKDIDYQDCLKCELFAGIEIISLYSEKEDKNKGIVIVCSEGENISTELARRMAGQIIFEIRNRFPVVSKSHKKEFFKKVLSLVSKDILPEYNLKFEYYSDDKHNEQHCKAQKR